MCVLVLIALPLVATSRIAVAELGSESGRLAAGGVLRLQVPEAIGGKTVVGQLTVDRAGGGGFVTAYGCADGMPLSAAGDVARSDLNFDGTLTPVASNRLLVKADNNGELCLFTSSAAALIVDINGVTFDTGVNSFPNRRTDTRDGALVAAGGVVTVNVPEARGGKAVIGQLTVDRATSGGFVSAYGCADGLPTDSSGRIARSDLNYVGGAVPVASNRLITQADVNGDVCFYTQRPVALIIDVNGVTDVGITSFANRRTDTRASVDPRVAAGAITRISLPEASGAKTVLGQLTVDLVTGAGFVTAYGCADGVPTDGSGTVSRSDLNFQRSVSRVASNRLIVQADANGDVCFLASAPVALIVDINGVSGAGISSFPNRRLDTRTGLVSFSGSVNGVALRTWPPFHPGPALAGVAALTGHGVDATVAARPILAVKIDNYATARPQWGLESADSVIELNVEGISRFVALFQSRLPDVIGPVRSARTEDFDLLSLMNRPIFSYSGANDGVLQWAGAADSAGLFVDFGAQHAPCYSRSDDKVGPHNLIVDTGCAYESAPTAGPARPMWTIDGHWKGSPVGAADTSFDVAMDGVAVQWRWDASAGVYQRWQDGEPHVSVDGAQLSASTVAVLSVSYVPSVADARSPDAITVGSGTAVVHRDGRSVTAIWSRATPYAPFRFVDRQTGAEIPLDVGTTWFELSRAG